MSLGQNPNARLSSKTRLVALIVILSQSLGNWSLAWGMKHDAPHMALSPIAVLRAIFSPWVGLGIVLLILWLLSRMALLSWADLSYVMPVTAISYVVTAFAGRLFLGENVSLARWVGIVLVTAGVTLVGRTAASSSMIEGKPQ